MHTVYVCLVLLASCELHLHEHLQSVQSEVQEQARGFSYPFQSVKKIIIAYHIFKQY